MWMLKREKQLLTAPSSHFVAHGLGNEATAVALIPIDFGNQAARHEASRKP